jgi:radical SAM superfamily enzyme YgiQ (UPF0313 family)
MSPSSGICLVIPPSPFLLDERVFMSLGVLKVAAALEQAGVYVEVLDLSGYQNYGAAVRDHAARSEVRCFGVTATTPQIPAAVEIADAIRGERADARIILGGPHATLVAAAMKREVKLASKGRAHRAYARLTGYFDVLVAGDGEAAVFAAMSSQAPELIDADGRHSPFFLNNERLDATPFPARHLIDVDSYRYQIEGVPALSIIAQLGCPFGCGFCAGRLSPMLRHIRMRTAENIVEEMRQLYRQYGRRGFMFYDDELNVNTEMVGLMRRIGAAQRALGVEWRLRGFVKAELFTDEQAEVMYEAGFRWLLVGFESGSGRILHNINKKSARDDNSRCIDIAHRHGLKIKALMSLGHPGESHGTAAETREWLLEARPDDFDVTVITPYPGSPYYDEAVETAPGIWAYSCRNGDRLYQREIDYTQVADYYKGDPDDGYVSYVYTDQLDPEEIVIERDRLEREVRQALGIPFNPGKAALLYEHSMGQTFLPPRMLRTSRAVMRALSS